MPYQTGIDVEVNARGARAGAAQVNQALDSMANHAQRSLSRLDRAMNGLTSGFTALRQRVFGLQGALTALGVTLFVRDAIKAQQTLDQMESALKAVTGSAAGAATEIAFLRRESERLGLAFDGTGQEYAKLAAATSKTSLGLKGAREIFTAVSEASTVMGSSAEETSGALTALVQIVSKGKVAMEELRGQLGERVAGAFVIAAQAFGKSTAQLEEDLTRGRISMEEFISRFMPALREAFARGLPDAVQNSRAELNRFSTAMQEVKRAFAQGGFMAGFLGGLKSLRQELKDEGTLDAMRELGGIAGTTVDLAFRAAAAAVGHLRARLRELKAEMDLLKGAGQTVEEQTAIGERLQNFWNSSFMLPFRIMTGLLRGAKTLPQALARRSVERRADLLEEIGRDPDNPATVEITRLPPVTAKHFPDPQAGERAKKLADLMQDLRDKAAGAAVALRAALESPGDDRAVEQAKLFHDFLTKALRDEIKLTPEATAEARQLIAQIVEMGHVEKLRRDEWQKSEEQAKRLAETLANLDRDHAFARREAALSPALSPLERDIAKAQLALEKSLAELPISKAALELQKEKVALEVRAKFLQEQTIAARERDRTLDLELDKRRALIRLQLQQGLGAEALAAQSAALEERFAAASERRPADEAGAARRGRDAFTLGQIEQVLATPVMQLARQRPLWEQFRDVGVDTWLTIAETGSQALATLEDTLVSMLTTGKAGFQDLAQSILADLMRLTIRTGATEPLGRLLGGFIQAGLSALMAGLGGGAVATVNAAGASGSAFPSAETLIPFKALGGIVGPQGDMPLRFYAAGGVARSPQLAVFGEGAMPEAFVPLPDGRSIPVSLPEGAGGPVHLTVILRNPIDPAAFRTTPEELVSVVANDIKHDGVIRRVIVEHTPR